MGRVYRFELQMRVEDDDQTDPADMEDIIEDVLNCKPGAIPNWQSTNEDTIPQYRPRFTVMVMVMDEGS